MKGEATKRATELSTETASAGQVLQNTLSENQRKSDEMKKNKRLVTTRRRVNKKKGAARAKHVSQIKHNSKTQNLIAKLDLNNISRSKIVVTNCLYTRNIEAKLENTTYKVAFYNFIFQSDGKTSPNKPFRDSTLYRPSFSNKKVDKVNEQVEESN